MTRKKSEDAVSPVIGVMLMLVVTVVIAAVVAIFATGMVEETEPAPIAKLNVEIIHDQPITGGESIANPNADHPGTVPTLHLTHVSGDSLNTENLKLSFSWECDNPACTQGHQHTSTYQAGKGEEITGGTYAAFDGKAYVPSGYGDTVEPLYINYGNSGGGFFGNHILKRGETMIAYDKHLMVPSDGVEHAGNPAMDVLFNNGEIITEYNAASTETVDVPGSAMDPDATYFVKHKDAGHSPSCRHHGKDLYWNPMEGLTCDCGVVAPCPFCNAKLGSTDVIEQMTLPNGMIVDGIVASNCNSCGRDVQYVGTPTIDQIQRPIEGTGGYSAGIMACLTEGTAVKVIITHTPSNKVIYEDRVFVE